MSARGSLFTFAIMKMNNASWLRAMPSDKKAELMVIFMCWSCSLKKGLNRIKYSRRGRTKLLRTLTAFSDIIFPMRKHKFLGSVQFRQHVLALGAELLHAAHYLIQHADSHDNILALVQHDAGRAL